MKDLLKDIDAKKQMLLKREYFSKLELALKDYQTIKRDCISFFV
jgi:hypothetical protein